MENETAEHVLNGWDLEYEADFEKAAHARKILQTMSDLIDNGAYSKEDIKAALKPKKKQILEIIEPTGSRHMCTEFREDSDYDFMCYTSEQDEAVITEYLKTQNFKFSKSWMNGSSLSYKNDQKPPQNLIVIRDRLTFERWRAATRACKYLDIKDKNERREIFHRVVHNEPLPDSMKSTPQNANSFGAWGS